MQQENLIFIHDEKFKEFGESIATMEIAEGKPIRKTVFFDNKEYIVTAGVGDGTGRGWEKLEAYQVIDFSLYKGRTTPIGYHDLVAALANGLRGRSFTGLLIRFQKRNLVFLEKYYFESNGISTTQTAMF